MKKISLVISLIILVMSISCGKSVLQPSSTKRKYKTKSFNREDLINSIRNIDDFNLNGMNINELVKVSLKNVEYNDNNTNEIIIVLERGPGFTPTENSAIKNINVEDAINTINKKFIENITNSTISNISCSINKSDLSKKVLTLRLNLLLQDKTKTDIDTNNTSLKLDLGELNINKRPSIQWWWR